MTHGTAAGVAELPLKVAQVLVYDTDDPAFRAMLARAAEIMRRRAGSAEEREVMEFCETAAGELWAEMDAAEDESPRRDRS